MRKQNKHREKMKQLRLERGWTQEDVGNMLGITGSAYGMIELGVRTPRLPLAVKMQELFGVPVAELFLRINPTQRAVRENLLRKETPIEEFLRSREVQAG